MSTPLPSPPGEDDGYQSSSFYNGARRLSVRVTEQQKERLLKLANNDSSGAFPGGGMSEQTLQRIVERDKEPRGTAGDPIRRPRQSVRAKSLDLSSAERKGPEMASVEPRKGILKTSPGYVPADEQYSSLGIFDRPPRPRPSLLTEALDQLDLNEARNAMLEDDGRYLPSSPMRDDKETQTPMFMAQPSAPKAQAKSIQATRPPAKSSPMWGWLEILFLLAALVFAFVLLFVGISFLFTPNLLVHPAAPNSKEAAQCAIKYISTQCGTKLQFPEIGVICERWRQCMGGDEDVLGNIKRGLEAVDDFVDHTSWAELCPWDEMYRRHAL